MPTDRLDESLRTLFARLVDAAPLAAPIDFGALANSGHGGHRRGGLAAGRKSRGWRRGAGALVVVGLAITLLVLLLPTSTGQIDDSSLGMTIGGATITPAVDGSGTVSLGHLPSGFHLVRRSRITDLVAPLNSSQRVTYEAVSGSEVPAIGVVLTPVLSSRGPLAALVSPGSGSVRGPVIGGSRSYLRTTHYQGDLLTLGPCSGVSDAGGRQLALVSEEVEWNVSTPVAGLYLQAQVIYTGARALAEATMLRMARSLRLTPDPWNCWSLRSGQLHQDEFQRTCTPGEVDAPPTGKGLGRAPVISTGTLFGAPWEFQAVTASCIPGGGTSPEQVVEFQLSGTNGLVCGGWGRAGRVDAEIENLPNGERVACGAVPSAVTSISMRSSSGPAVSIAVFHRTSGPWAFFAMSLGRSGASSCYRVCRGSLTMDLYKGPRLVRVYFWGGLGALSSERDFPL